MSERTEELRERIRNLQEQLHAAEAELQRVREEESPVQVGDIIRSKSTREEYIVRGLRFYSWTDHPSSLSVSTKKKNGEWSANTKGFWGSYEVVSHD